METNLNGGLTVSQTADAIRAHSHRNLLNPEVSELNLNRTAKAREASEKRKHEARMAIEEILSNRAIEDEYSSVGMGVNMHEPSKFDQRNTTGKGGFHKPGNGICLNLPSTLGN